MAVSQLRCAALRSLATRVALHRFGEMDFLASTCSAVEPDGHCAARSVGTPWCGSIARAL
jgi:hypothetical protein